MFSRLIHMLRRFGSSQDGNVAIIFGFALIPLIAFVGAAVDYSRATAVKAEMQGALDSVSLMLQKTALTSSANELQSAAVKDFMAVFAPKYDASNIKINATYSNSGGSSILVNGSVDIPTTFMGMFGYNTTTITASSTAKWGHSRLRVALVLDNTGSMAADNKLSALQTATKNLLTQLKNTASINGDVYVSIIPFVKDVNLDPSNYNASWIDWTAWDAANGRCSNTRYHNKSSCTSHYGVWTPKNHYRWNGCVVDRGGDSAPDPANYDTNVVPPTTSIAGTLFSAEQYSSCPQAAMGLSYDWSSMNTLVNNMYAAGNTNQAIGLALGWMSLAGGGPFTAPPMDSNYDYKQVIVLLTDGMNTQDRWYTSQSQIDARQKLTCDNIKAAGVLLYTIQVNTGSDPTSTLLKDCASSSDKFFLLTSAGEIVTTFNQIGTYLTQLYLAH
jgi:Flp pilus assembly protein TadG